METLTFICRLGVVFPTASVIFLICAMIVSSGVGLGSWLSSNIPLMLDMWTGFGEKKRKEAEEIRQELKRQQENLYERRYKE